MQFIKEPRVNISNAKRAPRNQEESDNQMQKWANSIKR